MHFDNLGLYPIDHTVFGPQLINSYPLLCNAFWLRLNRPPKRKSGETIQYAELYYLFITSLQLFSGIAGKNASEALEQLTTKSLRDIESGWLYLPRYRGEIPKRLSPISRLLGMALLLHLSRNQDSERHHLSPVPSQRLDAPILKKNMACNQRPLHSPYFKWLSNLGKAAGLARALRAKHLRKIIQIEFHKRLPTEFKPWIELQLDLWPHNPAPISQWEAFGILAQPLDFARIKAVGQRQDLIDVLEMPKWLRIANGLEPEDPQKIKPEKSVANIKYLLPIKEVVHEYHINYKTKPASPIRRRYRQRLVKITNQAKTALNAVLEDATLQDSEKARQLFHTTLIAGWLVPAFKGRGLSPATPLKRFYILQVLLRTFPGRLLTMLEDDELDELFDERGLASRTINSYVITLHSLRQYAEDMMEDILEKEEVKMVTSGFNLGNLFQFAVDIQPVALLTKPQLEEILGCLRLIESYNNQRAEEGRRRIEEGCTLIKQHGDSHKKENRLIKLDQARMRKGLRLAQQARLTYHGTLLQVLFGLRSKSALHVRINGLANLDGQLPSVLAPPTKGRQAFDSQIPAEHLDRGMLAIMEAFRRGRLVQADGDGSQYLLAAPDGTPLDYRQYCTTLERAMRMTGNRIQVGGRYASTHLLRHYAANRWLALGLPLRLIRDYMNHRQDSTTVGSYLHAVSFKLAELLFARQAEPEILFSQRASAFFLGVSPSNLRRMTQKEENKTQREKFSFRELYERIEKDYAQIPKKPEEDEEM